MLTGRTHQGMSLKRLAAVKPSKEEKTWIVVASQSGATFMTWSKDSELCIERSLKGNAHGREDRFERSDRPGRSFDSYTTARKGQTGPARHAMGNAKSPKELAAKSFANSIASILEKARGAKKFSRLILVAEPKFLGKIKGALEPQTKEMLKGVEKELKYVSGRELFEKVERLCATR